MAASAPRGKDFIDDGVDEERSEEPTGEEQEGDRGGDHAGQGDATVSGGPEPGQESSEEGYHVVLANAASSSWSVLSVY